jgi:hypothetical protein
VVVLEMKNSFCHEAEVEEEPQFPDMGECEKKKSQPK